MPRNLSRLKFRVPKPPPPLRVPPAALHDRQRLERIARRHVLARSRPPKALSLHVVVNPKWKDQPGKKTKKLARKPHTLKDLVDPRGEREHGQIIYIFRNIKTNQILYSFAEMLDQYHLQQLPFMGKKSKPATVRPVDWTPHCVVLFPTAHQGQDAFKRLRELRKLHELSWDKTDPQWKSIPVKQRIKRIQGQVENTSADLATVLRIQSSSGSKFEREAREHEAAAQKALDERWERIEALVQSSMQENSTNSPEWLEKQVESLTRQLTKESNQNEADQKRLKTVRRNHQARIRKVLFYRRLVEQYKKVEAELKEEANPAEEPDAIEKLERLETRVRELESQLEKPSRGHTEEDIDTSLNECKQQYNKLRLAFSAQEKLETRNHYGARCVLPKNLKKQLPEHYTTSSVELHWADLFDAQYAGDAWPPRVQHTVLPLNRERQKVEFLSAKKYQEAIDNEVESVVNALERSARRDEGEEDGEEYTPPAVAAPVEKKTGIWQYLPNMQRTFKRAEV